MKSIGRTDYGNHIVELSTAEMQALVALMRVASRKSPFPHRKLTTEEEKNDLGNVLNTIRSFVEAGTEINNAIWHLEDVQTAIFGPKEG